MRLNEISFRNYMVPHRTFTRNANIKIFYPVLCSYYTVLHWDLVQCTSKDTLWTRSRSCKREVFFHIEGHETFKYPRYCIHISFWEEGKHFKEINSQLLHCVPEILALWVWHTFLMSTDKFCQWEHLEDYMRDWLPLLLLHILAMPLSSATIFYIFFHLYAAFIYW